MGRYSRFDNYDRVAAARDFLNSGSVQGRSSSELYVGSSTDSGRAGCRSSADCAAGWSCINGYCNNATSSYSSSGSGCGSGGYGEGYGGCQEGDGGCSQPGCGGNVEGQDCCGTRCCRFFGTGIGLGVQCFCGECPPPQKCSAECDEYYKTWGDLKPGCDGELKVCSECEECGIMGPFAFCDPISDAPCHCEGASACGQCEKCNRETGSCEEDCNSCEVVHTLYNQECCCGTYTIQCREPGCGPTPGGTKKCLEEGCKKACGDKCEKDCTTQVIDTTTVEGVPTDVVGEDLVCPDYYKWTGTMDVGGTRIIFCEKRVDPCDLECSCDSDCGECEKCEAEGVNAGTCVKDDEGCCTRCRYDVERNDFGAYYVEPFTSTRPMEFNGPSNCRPMPGSPDFTICDWEYSRWADCGDGAARITSTLQFLQGYAPNVLSVSECEKWPPE